ncbi:MAG: hypothetical protein ACFFD8_08105 [Candidatus Thorarchaeota archaeon]
MNVTIMAGVTNHPLIKTADQIASRTSPEKDREDIRRLLYSIILYIKRVETGGLTPEERQFKGHRRIRFQDIAPSQDIASGLRDRIRIIDDYRIVTASRIFEILLFGFEKKAQRPLTKDQVDVLRVVSLNPLINVTGLSHELKKSRYTIGKVLSQLVDQYGLMRFYHQNRGKLKLTTFSLVFRTKSFEDSQRLESWVRETQSPFLSTLVFDVAYRNGYITYAVPSQQRAYRLFEQRINQLKNKYFEKSHLQRVLEVYWNIRFDGFNSQLGQWEIPLELAEISHIAEPKGNENVEIPYCYHADLRTSCFFSRIDFLIAQILLSAHHKIHDIGQRLSEYGYHMSNGAIRLRINHLKKERILVPTIYFSGGGFEEFILLSVFCNSVTQKKLQIFASRFPLAFTYITEEGIAIFLKRPSGWKDLINKLIREISQQYEIDDLMVVYQEHNLGSGLSPELYRRWNEKRQYWEFTDEEI